MTERLYYTDSNCRVFDAHVLQQLEHEGRPAVVLDRTAFYPTSGGQPFDVGLVGGVQVLETVDADDEIVHVLAAAIATGTPVRGEIEWSRRFDHMQQHTGQHVLSAAFDRLSDNRTMSFHMGAESATIDLAREVTPSELERIVDEANRIVWEDRPVTVSFATEEEAKRLPLRKESLRPGTLRLIDVQDYDLSACGGTHVSTTGRIGIIAALATERFRGGTRVTFACGGRALRAFRTYRDAVAGSIRVVSVLPDELPSAIEKLQGEARELRKTSARFQESLAGHEAARLLALAQPHGGTSARLVVEVLAGWDAPGLKAIASALAAAGDVAAAVVSASSPAFVAVSRSTGLNADAGKILKQLVERFGGRGGGRPELAQGGGLAGPPEEIAAAARTLLSA